MKRNHSSLTLLTRATLVAGLLTLAGCGSSGGLHAGSGGYGPYIPLGDIEVDNQTDLVPPPQDLYSFQMAPSGTALWSGELLYDVVYPGEIAFVGSFEEDYYDAEAWLAGFPDVLIPFYDVFVEGGFTTTFEVY